MVPGERPAADIRDALLAAANSDGGWGYYAGRSSRLEPTCWAFLGLHAAGALARGQSSSTGQLLRSWQRSDGFIEEPALKSENRPNIAFNGLAAWLLLQHADVWPDAAVAALVGALGTAKGTKLPASDINRQDMSLQGWAWIDGTFSWVEPTCWGLLALKAAKSTAAIRARIDEGERLLIDRCCPTGGWNYGNSNMLGQDLRAYVPTTALGLLAMVGREPEPCVRRSVEFLAAHQVAERSAMALGLAIPALRAYGRPTHEATDALRQQWDRMAFMGNAHLMGLALYGLAHG